MKFLLQLVVGGLAVYITALLTPGIHVAEFWTAILVSILIALINAFIRPVLILLTIPVTIFTLGLFLFVINGFTIWLAGKIAPGFHVAHFGYAILFSVILSAIEFMLQRLLYPRP